MGSQGSSRPFKFLHISKQLWHKALFTEIMSLWQFDTCSKSLVWNKLLAKRFYNHPSLPITIKFAFMWHLGCVILKTLKEFPWEWNACMHAKNTSWQSTLNEMSIRRNNPHWHERVSSNLKYLLIRVSGIWLFSWNIHYDVLPTELPPLKWLLLMACLFLSLLS